MPVLQRGPYTATELPTLPTEWLGLAYCHPCDAHSPAYLTRVEAELVGPMPQCDICEATLTVSDVYAATGHIGRLIDTYLTSTDYRTWERATRVLVRIGILPDGILRRSGIPLIGE